MRGKLLEINIQNFVYRWNGAEAANQKVYGVAIMNPLFGGAIPTHEKIFHFCVQIDKLQRKQLFDF